MTTLAIDLETYSDHDIKYGVNYYTDTPNFEILLFAYAVDDDPVEIVDLAQGEDLPQQVWDMLYDPAVTKTAFNANFEIACLKRLFPDLPAKQWECTSVLALYNGYPTGLDNVARILHLDADAQKDKRGKALIQYFSVPCKYEDKGDRLLDVEMPYRHLPADAPEKWKQFKEYCRQDVVVERAIRKALLHNPPPVMEQLFWHLDRKINRAGVMVDQELVTNAIRLNADYQAKLLEEARRITGLDNPNSVIQLKAWLKDQTGKEIIALDKKAVTALLQGKLPPPVRRLLQLRRQMGKTSIKKYAAMMNALCSDGRIHDVFQFYAAMRTGRWAGRTVQLHNLPQNHMPDLDDAQELVRAGDLEVLSMLYDVPDTLSQLIRTALIAPRGSRFIVADFSAIEARVIAWMAGETWRSEAFAEGKDIYCASASRMFGVPVEKHGVNSHLRAKGKIAELALGYGGGVNAMKAMGAEDMGLSDDELTRIISQWREASPKIVKMWSALESAAIRCIRTKKPCTAETGKVSFEMDGPDLRMVLPSSRKLSYPSAKIGTNRFGKPSVSFQGMEQSSRVWTDLETYGGKLTENAVQATARDCLAYAMLQLNNAGYKIVMHVHDEVVIEMPKGKGSLEEVIRIMCETLDWDEGLLLNAAGFESPYYMKD